MSIESLMDTLRQAPLTLVTTDGGRYEVRGADYWHRHPVEDILIVISPSGGVALLPIGHISAVRLKMPMGEEEG